MDRIILHCDLNSFYASVELRSRPDLQNVPVAVCGDPTSRHGIILAKNEPAKKFGVQTAETIWQAKKKCPELVLLPPHHKLYRQVSKEVNTIYEQYTDLVEPFGIDESWLDVTHTLHLFGGDAKALADHLRQRMKQEMGLTLSVGVSFNKVFAKLGSDYRKPDATTVVSRENWQRLVSSTPVALILGLLCAILPVGGTIFIAAVVILADMYALSIEVCLVALLLFVLIYFIYFRFAPRQGMGVLLTPICFRLNIPYVIPVGMGLLEEAYSVFAVICGTVVYFFLDGVRQNEKLLGSAAEESAEANSKIVVALNQLLGNKEMYLVLSIMAVTLIIVYLIRRMSIANAWQIAIASGILFETIGLIAGYMLLGISGKTVSVLVGNVISLLIAFVIQFLFFNLDYSRTERLQFEDDEYYYYVKAVPKAVVSGTNKQVKRFSGKDEKERLTKKRFAEEMDIDEELLD